MPLLRLDKASLHYGTQILLDAVDLSISRGQKLGLLGRNGAGKTSLLKILAGEIAPDSGERWLRPGVRMARLEQTLPHADDIRVGQHLEIPRKLDPALPGGEPQTGHRHIQVDPRSPGASQQYAQCIDNVQQRSRFPDVMG